MKGRVCCRLRWFAVAETVAGPGGAAVFLLPHAEVPIPASSPPPFLSVFLLAILASLSLFFSSLLSLYSSVFFLSFLLCFFLSLFSFFLSFCSSSAAPFSTAFSSPVFIGKYMGERPTTLVQSWHRGRVVGEATVQLPQDRPRGTSPLFFTPW